VTERAPMCLMSCDPARELARAVAEELGVEVTESRDQWFACGEGKHVIGVNVRGHDVYLFQQPVVPGSERSLYDRWTMLLHAVDAARQSDAERITVVLPYFPGSRQDKRKGHTREGVSTGLFARMMEAAGVSMVITVEPHNEAMSGCFDPRLCVLESVSITRGFCDFIRSRGLQRDVVASTDVGGLERARRFALGLGSPVAALSKERDYSRPSQVAQTTVIGEVAGKSVLIIDDIVDTAGSVVAAVDSLWDAGAKDIVIAGAHMLLSGPAWARLEALRGRAEARGCELQVVGTSSVVHAEAPDWYHSYPLEPLLAQIVRRVNTRGSVRALERK